MAKEKNGKNRILLFEDSDIFADMVLEFLNAEGYETERAENGLEGIKKVHSLLPELIISDIEMPLFKGYQSTRLLKSRPSTRNIPVIMFTSLGETKDRFWGELSGADYYIEKAPENFSLLLEQMEKLLSEKREIDFEQIKREARRINDNSLIEMVNNLLDNKLYQTTLIGLLTDLSCRLSSLEETLRGVFDLLTNLCQAEIASIMIKDDDNSLLVYNYNNAGFNEEISADFKAITIADFNTRFSDYKVINHESLELKNDEQETKKLENNKRIESYIMIPLASGGIEFATMHIGTTIKEYFSPIILENLNVFLSSAAPIIANALRLKQMELLQKKTRAAFARYVPIDVMDEIIKKSSTQSTQSETRVVTILFSDIRSFTSISENTPAQELVNFLNRYFSLMGYQITSEGGNIDKFIGDAIMAIFGAPKSLDNSSASALKAALRMVASLATLDVSGIHLPEQGFATGIGLNCGECVVGNIGFQDKLDYTVIGDTVNLASRVEGVTKYYRQPIIVTENIYNDARGEFIFRKADSVRVVGKDHPVALYTVYACWDGEEEEGIPGSLIIDRESLDQYNKGLQLYTIAEFKTAKQYFSKALEINKKKGRNDYLSSLYLSRISEFEKNPPPKDWDATITMTEK